MQVVVVMANDGVECVTTPEKEREVIERVKAKYHKEWVREGSRYDEPYRGSGRRYVHAYYFDVEQ